MPVAKGGYKPRHEWLLFQVEQEKALSRRHVTSEEVWSKATHPLVPLAIGTVVSVQN